MLEKIRDLHIVDPFFVIELKKDKQKKIEINKLHKISINVVKRKKIVMSIMLIGLLILNLAYVDSLIFKFGITFLIVFLFVAIYTLYNKQYTIVIELKNKDKLRYLVTLRKKSEMKEKILHIRDLQFKQNFKD